MSLSSNVNDLAGRIATEFNTVRSEMPAGLPAGGTAGQILSKVDGTDYNTTWIDNFAPNVELYAKNQSGSAMTKGQVVYIAGVDNASDTPRLALADADTEATSSKTIGRLKQDIPNDGFGYVVTEGIIEGIGTGSATAGQSIWLSSTAGGVVYGAPPAKPAHGVYLGVVVRAHASNGKVYVKVQNGFETTELHDFSSTQATDGQVPVWSDELGLYVPGNISSGAIVSEAAPTGAADGQFWLDSTTLTTYVRYDSSWVQAAPAGPIGPTGPEGPAGADGATGPQGPPGEPNFNSFMLMGA